MVLEELKRLQELLASRGKILTQVDFCRYIFEEGDPESYEYRLEMLSRFPSHKERKIRKKLSHLKLERQIHE